jgi:hypothetical protein
MPLLKRLFGKKSASASSGLEELSLEVEVSRGGESEELAEEDYCHNHCFIFYGLNEAGFSSIEGEVQNFDGPNHLSYLPEVGEGVIMSSIFELSAGDEDVAATESLSDLMEWVERSIDSNLEEIWQNYDSTLSEECIALMQTEKSFLAAGIAGATRAWAAGDSFQTEDFVGAALVFMKSSKAFDARDSASDQQDGFNLPVVASAGFVRSCIYACEETNKINYEGGDEYEGSVDELWDEVRPRGNNPINQCSYGQPFCYLAPFGFSYFDQLGRLWNLDEISKAVTLHWEDEDNNDVYVSH